MWTPLSAGRRVHPLTLAVVMLWAAAPAEPQIELVCCLHSGSRMPSVDILSCREQEPRKGCNYHAYVIEADDGRIFCVSPNSPKLQGMLSKKKLTCPPSVMLIYSRVAYRVTAEDDVVE